jgi:hypothetical protein
MAEKAEKEKMRTLPHGEINTSTGNDGFIMLRGMVVFFIVLFCFAVILFSMSIFSHQSAVLLENVQTEIKERNTQVMRLIQ